MDRRQTKSPGSTPLTEIEGQLEHVTYHNEETGYTVARLKTYGQREPVTIVGQIMAPTPGEILTLKGEWSNHNQYGTQFKVKYYQTKIPASVQGIRKYLGSGLIKGIGPVIGHYPADAPEHIYGGIVVSGCQIPGRAPRAPSRIPRTASATGSFMSSPSTNTV